MKWYGDILLDLIFKFLKGILKENIIRLYVFFKLYCINNGIKMYVI